jgi:DNA-binding MarR family transcriptional regulator
MTYSAASQLTDRLVKKGFATRAENKEDRRVSEIRLTDEGQDVVRRIRLQRVEGMSQILGRMDPGQRSTLIENLEHFILAAIEDEKTALEACSHCGREHLSECVVNEVYKAATGMPIKQI